MTTPSIYALGTVTTVVSLLVLALAIGLAWSLNQRQQGIQAYVNVPIVDSVVAGANWALRSHAAPPQRSTPGFDVPWVQLSHELTALGLR